MVKSEKGKFLTVCLSIIVFFAICYVPIEGLEPLGKMYLGAVLSMLILWFTQAVPSSATFFLQIGLCTLMMPILSDTKASEAFKINMNGFNTNTEALFICAFFIVAAVEKSGLARRIALLILKFVGPKPKHFIMGILFASVFMNLFLPAAMSVSALLTGIVGGMLVDYKLSKDNNLSKSIYLAVGVGTIAGNIFIQTAGAPAIAVTGLIANNFGYEISYFEYMKFGFPLAVLMQVFAYFFITRFFPTDYKVLPGGREYIEQQLKSLGIMSAEEKKTGIILLITVILWMTGSLHHLSTQTIAMIAVFVMICPAIGCFTFKGLAKEVPWGTVIFCASSMSLANGMVTYGTASWLVNALVNATNMTNKSIYVIVALTLVIMVFCSFFFSIRVACTNSLIPCAILLAGTLAARFGANFSPMGFTMVMFYPTLFACILPVHCPYTLIPYAAGGFETKDLLKVQIPNVILTAATCFVLYFTYWKFIGLTM